MIRSAAVPIERHSPGTMVCAWLLAMNVSEATMSGRIDE